MEYTLKIDTPSYMCDVADRLHPWAAVRLCQEVTEYHGNCTGIGFKTLKENNQAWVITRALYNIYRRPDAFEPITLATWARGNNGVYAMRDYEMRSESGQVLLGGTSYWPLIDLRARRAIRLGSVVEGYEVVDRQATDHARLDKIVPPPMDDGNIIMRRAAVHSMLDHTQHVNNSEYIRLIFDCLSGLGFDVDRPFSLSINYNTESIDGEELTVFHSAIDRTHYFKITNPRAISVLAQVRHL